MAAAQSMVLEHSDAAVGCSLRRTKDRFKVKRPGGRINPVAVFPTASRPLIHLKHIPVQQQLFPEIVKIMPTLVF
ncbi:hypothetical protein HZ326_28431 [Fusarium oxysporum f. sp. albedinis]|nr:hypothetical protein HZ326_28431 [Fusarium oxysporum f. sp. albedinis]